MERVSSIDNTSYLLGHIPKLAGQDLTASCRIYLLVAFQRTEVTTGPTC